MEVPFSEMGKVVLWRKGRRGPVLDKLIIWCLLENQVEMSSQQWETLVWNSSESKDGNMYPRVISTRDE